ncbi:metal-sulfur cluster assembly factor [Patescibacteria group bacterium]|nr:metal-sulfur cluster assembly factor [Patescibacteria group bacterium]MBU1702895.1 metal-sulfur cluster assembly factor [Patescibacteria group bacterium]MBU1954060.1 metal-sulfur cluster assembly factor [Patescibacteria group bacterium]
MEKKTKYNFGEKHLYYKILNRVLDPELGIGVADMGLIYDVKVDKKGFAHVVMTLTSMGCPLAPDIAADIDSIMRTTKGVKDVDIEVVWDPPWTPDKMKPEIKEMLFGC